MQVPTVAGMGGQQLDSLRRANVAAVLSRIRAHGPVSRTEISVAVGLSPTAVTKIAGELMRAGYIVEAELPTSPIREPGRPRRPVRLNASRYRVVGVHIGLRRTIVGLVDLHGEVVELRSRAHTSQRARNVAATTRRMVSDVLRESETATDTVLGYGVSSGGWVSPSRGLVREFAGLGWRDVPLASLLAVEGLPAPLLDSGVRALAQAEAGLVSAAGVDNVVYLFVGNVIGCAHVLRGQIAPGRGESAGVIDHLSADARGGIECSCGRRDCLWAVASDAAALSAAHSHGLLAEGSLIEDLVALSQSASAGAAAAAQLLEDRARKVGHAVGVLLDLYDPDMLIVGGGVGLAPEHLPALVTAARARTVLPHDTTVIRPAAMVGPSGLLRGAATPALTAFYADPLAIA